MPCRAGCGYSLHPTMLIIRQFYLNIRMNGVGGFKMYFHFRFSIALMFGRSVIYTEHNTLGFAPFASQFRRRSPASGFEPLEKGVRLARPQALCPDTRSTHI